MGKLWKKVVLFLVYLQISSTIDKEKIPAKQTRHISYNQRIRY